MTSFSINVIYGITTVWLTHGNWTPSCKYIKRGMAHVVDHLPSDDKCINLKLSIEGGGKSFKSHCSMPIWVIMSFSMQPYFLSPQVQPWCHWVHPRIKAVKLALYASSHMHGNKHLLLEYALVSRGEAKFSQLWAISNRLSNWHWLKQFLCAPCICLFSGSKLEGDMNYRLSMKVS